MPGAGRLHQRVTVVRRRRTLPIGLRRVFRLLHAPAVHSPGVQHRSRRGRGHRGRFVRANRVVVPAFPVAAVVHWRGHVGHIGGRWPGLQGIGDGGHYGARVRRGLLT